MTDCRLKHNEKCNAACGRARFGTLQQPTKVCAGCAAAGAASERRVARLQQLRAWWVLWPEEGGAADSAQAQSGGGASRIWRRDALGRA